MMRTILIDSSALCYQAAFADGMGDLSYNNAYTGVIYGFLRQLLSISEVMHSNQFVFCWDGPRSHCVRKKAFPGYKDREKSYTSEEDRKKWELNYAQFTKLRTDIIPSLGFVNSFYLPGFEADDIIGKIVRSYYQDEWGGFFVVSSDEDLYQLLDDCVMYKLKKKVFYGAAQFAEEHGIAPRQWAEVKAIAGCNSDTVPGVPGVGEKTVIKYLRGELAHHLKTYERIVDNMDSDECSDTLVAFNRKLVTLPHAECPPIQLFEFRDHPLSYQQSVKVFQGNGFRSFLTGKHADAWRRMIEMR